MLSLQLLPARDAPGPDMVALYGCIMLLWGVSITWSASACASPVLGEVVPAQQHSIVYSFDRAFEGLSLLS